MLYDYLFKYVVVGDSGVGKSCLLLQFTDSRFESTHDLTIGVEFGTKTLKINNQDIKLQCFDTAGQESFRSITRSYYRNSAVALLVFDLTRRDTFKKLDDWVYEVEQNNNDDVIIVLVGNKADSVGNRVISEQEAMAYAKNHGMSYIETSAKTGQNVEQVFKLGAQKVYSSVMDGSLVPSDTSGIKLGIDRENTQLKRLSSCPCWR